MSHFKEGFLLLYAGNYLNCHFEWKSNSLANESICLKGEKLTTRYRIDWNLRLENFIKINGIEFMIVEGVLLL